MKKVVLLLTICVLLAISFSLNISYAYTYEDWAYLILEDPDRDVAWEYTWDLDYGATFCPIGELCAGFETFLIDEYYAWANTILDDTYAKAGLHNLGQSWCESSWKKGGVWSKSEIKAKTDTAYFRIKLGSNSDEGEEWVRSLFLTRKHETHHK